MRSKLGRGSLDITWSFRRPFSTKLHIRGDTLPVLISQPGYALPDHTARTNGRDGDPCIRGQPLLHQVVSFPSWRYIIKWLSCCYRREACPVWKNKLKTKKP